MPTLVIHAPRGRENKPTPNYKSFESIFASSVGPDYAVTADLFARLYPGCGVVLLCKDKPRRAEGTLVKLVPTIKAGNGIQRYDVYIENLKMVPYKPESLNRNGVAVIQATRNHSRDSARAEHRSGRNLIFAKDRK